jgi:hypothetical protein
MTSRVDRNSSAASHHVAVSLRKAFVRNTIRDRANQPPCGIAVVARGRTMRELEASLQQFSEFILRVRLAKENAAPYFVRWVPRFLTRPASNEPLADQVRTFCEGLEHEGRWADWQVRQAEHALRIYFVHFLKRTDWADEAAEHRRRTGSRQSSGRSNSASSDSNAPLLVPHRVHLR